ncbi:MAG: primosomal protein N', partial [Clostridia bacterium]|nr:primosomal protein N' [Clostridia bacterium]
ESEEQLSLKQVIDVLDDTPVISAERIPLISFLKEQYFISNYRALSCMLPAGLDFKLTRAFCYTGNAYTEEYNDLVTFVSRRKKAPTLEDFPLELRGKVRQAMLDGILATEVQSKRNLGDLADKMLTLAIPLEEAEEYRRNLSPRFEGQSNLLELLFDHANMSVKEAMYFSGCSVSSLQTLAKKGLIRIYFEERRRTPYENLQKATDDSEVLLNEEQQTVYERIASCMPEGRQTHLIHGITGSGKTHVYMKLMDRVLGEGKSVLFLVPEISLTPQTLARFFARYGEKVAVIHSGLTMGQRMDEWKKIRQADHSLVVGTRSAVFAPINRLGLIILDEEHEPSYKSESAPKFHARDIAHFLSAQYNIPMILGSATPSIETYFNAQKGKYHLHSLTTRFNTQPLPEVEMVDMRDELHEGAASFLSESLKEQIKNTLQNKQQVILFLNRRGTHTGVICQKCGYVLKCPACGISMTYHSANNRCICHFCSHSIKMFDTCPECGDSHIRMTGYGTQYVEKQLTEFFPDARVLRMDMDTVTNYVVSQTMMSDFAAGKYDILLGTQMVAKGLNFPNVTLVGVLQADMSLYVEDFRAGERTFSLLTQVCGRSGRSDKPGKAVIQSYCPDHEILNFAKNQDYLSFYDYEIKFRKAIKYPPYCDLALFTISASSHNVAFAASGALFAEMEKHAQSDAADIPLRLLRPSVPRISQVNEKFRMQMIVKCRNSAKFRNLADVCMDSVMSEYNATVTVDINPLSF